MTTASLSLLVLQGLVFLVWAVLMFRTLFRLNRIAMERRTSHGKDPLIGMTETFSTFGDFAAGRLFPHDRTRLILATALLIALIFARIALLG